MTAENMITETFSPGKALSDRLQPAALSRTKNKQGHFKQAEQVIASLIEELSQVITYPTNVPDTKY